MAKTPICSDWQSEPDFGYSRCGKEYLFQTEREFLECANMLERAGFVIQVSYREFFAGAFPFKIFVKGYKWKDIK